MAQAAKGLAPKPDQKGMSLCDQVRFIKQVQNEKYTHATEQGCYAAAALAADPFVLSCCCPQSKRKLAPSNLASYLSYKPPEKATPIEPSCPNMIGYQIEFPQRLLSKLNPQKKRINPESHLLTSTYGPWPVYTCACVCVHIRTSTHMYIHTQVHMHISTHAHTYAQKHTHTHIDNNKGFQHQRRSGPLQSVSLPPLEAFPLAKDPPLCLCSDCCLAKRMFVPLHHPLHFYLINREDCTPSIRLKLSQYAFCNFKPKSSVSHSPFVHFTFL